MIRFDDGGLRNVWSANGYPFPSIRYGKAISFHDLYGLTRAVCTTLKRKPGHLTGAEFRYLRLGGEL